MEKYLIVLCISFLAAPVHLLRARIPYYFACPGVAESEIGLKFQVRLGVMFSFPANFNMSDLDATGVNVSNGDLVPGELLIPYSPLSVIAWNEAVWINNGSASHDILPHHHFCLFYTFVPDDFLDTSRASSYLFVHSGVRQAINAITDKHQFLVNAGLVVKYTPLISVMQKLSQDICPQEQSPLIKTFLGESFTEEQCTGIKDKNLNIVTTTSNLFLATHSFMKRMGWKRFGIITSCSTFLDYWPSSDTVRLAYYINGSNLVEAFNSAGFQENELNIFVYIGCLKVFRSLLLEAKGYGFMNFHRDFVWVVPLLQPNYCETKLVRNILPNIFFVKPVQQYPYAHSTRYNTSMYEGYMADAITLQVNAAQKYLAEKAHSSGVNLSDVSLGRDDYFGLTSSLFAESFWGYTGFVSFDGLCNRMTSVYEIAAFSLPNATRGIRIGGYVYTSTSKSTTVEIHFLSENQTLTNSSDSIFQNSTIPLDHVERLYNRNNSFATLTLIVSGIVYFVVSVLYVSCVCYHDKIAGVYDESWLYQRNDINYSLDRFTNDTVVVPWQSNHIKTNDDQIGQINNKLVYIHKLKMDKSLLNIKLRKAILEILNFNHENVCSFVGGILEGTTIISIMYEYCHRGSLLTVLCNPHITFNQPFRMSFAMDAAKGLGYLHNKKVVHGRLTSSNCLVDQHWNLKLTDYSISEVYSRRIKRNSLVSTLTEPNDFSSDVYNYGVVLMEMCCRQTLLQDEKIDLESTYYDEDVTISMIMLIEKCMIKDSTVRPSISIIKAKLKRFLSLYGYLSHDASAAVEVYSRNLEDHIEAMENTLHETKEKNDHALSNCIPTNAVEAIREGNIIPLDCYHNVPVICFALCDTESISLNDMEVLINKTDNMLNGVCTENNMQRIQCNGTMWLYIGDVYNSAEVTSLVRATASASKILKSLVNCNIPISVSVDCGIITSGIVKEKSSFHTVFGDTLNFAVQLMLMSPKHTLLVSEAVKNYLPARFSLMYFTTIIDPDGVSVNTYTVNVAAEEEFISCSSNLHKRHSVIEIKSPMRKASEMESDRSVRLSDISFRSRSSLDLLKY